MANETKKRRWPYVALAVAALGIGVGWVAIARLDAMLLARAQSEADAYGQKLGRKIKIGQLSTTLLSGAGIRVGDVEVGPSSLPGSQEDAPLLRLERAEVKVALWPVLRSRGEEIPVRTAEIAGLLVNVIRRKDGITNLEEVSQKLSPPQGTESPAQEAGPARDLSAVRVDHAALTGEIHFLDRSGPQPRELAIRQIDLRIDDLHAGKPLEVVLKAAVLAPAQNLAVKLTTAPLPSSLVPIPDRLAIALQPIDLTPLAPFLPASVGLRSGAVDVDFQAQLGSAVPGGHGPTRLVGTVHAKGLQFAEAEGGKALDAELLADVTGDAERGDLKMDRLHMALGPAELDGQGEVQGLLTAQPAVKGLTLTGKNLDPERVAQYYPPLRKKLRGISGPLGLSMRASGTAAHPALSLALDFTPMQLAISGQLAKAAGARMSLDATLSGSPTGGGALHFEGRMDLTGVDLRPGGQLNKAPGQQAEVAVTGSYQPLRGKGEGLRLEISSLVARVLGDALTGTAKLEQAGKGKSQTTHFSVALRTAHLNADALLLSGAESETHPEAHPTGSSTARAPSPAADLHRYDGMKGEVDLQLAALHYKDTDFENVAVNLKLEGDQLTVQHFKAGVHGGEVSLDGTQMHLAPAEPPFKLKVKASGLQMAALLPRSVPSSLVTGRFSGDVSLAGAGMDRQNLAKSLTGLIQGQIADGVFNGVDLISEVSAPLAKAVPFGALGIKPGQGTSLGKVLPFGLELANGVARLKKPLEIAQERGSLKVDGGIALDGKLNLTGEVSLAPATVLALTKGKVTLTEPLPIGFKLTGPVSSPQVSGVDLHAAVQLLIRTAATGGLEKLVGGMGGGPQGSPSEGTEDAKRRLQEKAKEKLRGLFGH